MTGDDYERLGEDAARFVTWDGNKAFMRLEEIAGHERLHRCAALLIDPDRSDGLVFTCAVYERRPTVCRELEQGGGACQGELATKGDRPKRALAMLR